MLVYHGSYLEIKNPDVNYGRFNLDFGKGFYLGQLQYSKPNNQYCIASQKGIEALKFIDSYTLEG